ncbi:MAG TPA: vWA domain-containing protein [Myxococcota bacterium]|nr:vWA domain-containing protein [Myxococcota bacterium]
MTRSGKLLRIRGILFLAAAALTLLAVLGGCNYDWTFYRNSFTGSKLEFVSVVPAHKEEDGTYTRQCVYDPSRKVDSVLMSFALVGAGLSSDTTTKDNDTAIRPGDMVKAPDGDRVIVEMSAESEEPRAVSEENFNVKVSCLDPYPIANQTTTSGGGSQIKCTRQESIDGSPDTVAYTNNLSDGTLRLRPDSNGISVAIMIDQSGSMKGYVEASSFAEISIDSKVPIAQFATRATDYQAFRTTAVQALMRQLNAGDRAGIFQFGEAVSGVEAKILCDGTFATEADARSACFGINRAILNSNQLSSLQSEAEGRTPLWQSVKDVYKYLKETETKSLARHIFIITDGPDTCARNSPDFLPFMRYQRVTTGPWLSENQNDSCSDVAWDDFLDYIWDDVMNEDGTPKSYDQIPVHVSIVQMQSRGYPEMDPFQQQLACLTGGHYTFINASDLPGSNEVIQDGNHPLQDALTAAATKFRLSLSGVWQAAKKVNDLSDGSLTAGAMTALDGEIAVVPSDTAIFSESMKTQMTKKIVSDVDTRGIFLIPSGGQALACDWMPLTWADKDDAKAEACRVAELSAAKDVCVSLDADFGTICSTGTCCYGMCVAAAPECQVLDELCNYDNVEDGTPCTGGTCDEGICVPAGA